MTTLPTTLLPRSATLAPERLEALTVYRTALWTMLAAKLLAAWGVQWDIQWHVLIGRDSFWIAPHVMTYTGVAIASLVSFAVLGWDTRRALIARARPSGTKSFLGLTGTPGFHLAAWGIGLTILAAPVDDLWHRLFGLDVTLWSPPHLLGLLGALVNTLALIRIAQEAYPNRHWLAYAATVLAAANAYGILGFALQPSGRLAYLYGGVWFYTFTILAPVLLPVALVMPTRVSGRRWTPVLAFAVVLTLGFIGVNIARVGFEILQPVSVIREEIAKDPTSPIAIGYEIARKNRTVPGGSPVHAQFAFIVPVAMLALVDARRRPTVATLAYAVGLFGVWTLVVGRLPAFHPMAPGAGAGAIALLLTIVAAFAGAAGACRLANALTVPAAGSPGAKKFSAMVERRPPDSLATRLR